VSGKLSGAGKTQVPALIIFRVAGMSVSVFRPMILLDDLVSGITFVDVFMID
jgi:hypothetical protein